MYKIHINHLDTINACILESFLGRFVKEHINNIRQEKTQMSNYVKWNNVYKTQVNTSLTQVNTHGMVVTRIHINSYSTVCLFLLKIIHLWEDSGIMITLKRDHPFP